MKKQSGFTLIELIVVILILGILAATALPKFVSIEKEANEASHKGVAAGVQASIALIHSKWLVLGKPTATAGNNNSIDIDDDAAIDFYLNNAGWPISAAATANDAAITDATCLSLWNALLQAGGPQTTTGTAAAPATATEYSSYVTAATVCHYEHTGSLNAAGTAEMDMTFTPGTGAIAIDSTI